MPMVSLMPLKPLLFLFLVHYLSAVHSVWHKGRERERGETYNVPSRAVANRVDALKRRACLSRADLLEQHGWTSERVESATRSVGEARNERRKETRRSVAMQWTERKERRKERNE